MGSQAAPSTRHLIVFLPASVAAGSLSSSSFWQLIRLSVAWVTNRNRMGEPEDETLVLDTSLRQLFGSQYYGESDLK